MAEETAFAEKWRETFSLEGALPLTVRNRRRKLIEAAFVREAGIGRTPSTACNSGAPTRPSAIRPSGVCPARRRATGRARSLQTVKDGLSKFLRAAGEALVTGGVHTPNHRWVMCSALARIRRGRVSATIYGGSDWPLGVASGLASNPTFFNFRKGRAVLESVRMGANFFSKGYFRSAGLQANGNQ